MPRTRAQDLSVDRNVDDAAFLTSYIKKNPYIDSIEKWKYYRNKIIVKNKAYSSDIPSRVTAMSGLFVKTLVVRHSIRIVYQFI